MIFRTGLGMREGVALVAAVLLLPAAGCTAADEGGGLKPRRTEQRGREVWCIRCLTLEGPNRFQNARNFEQALKKVDGLKARLVQVLHEETNSAIYYGRYERRYDAARDKESFKPDPLPDLELIRTLSLAVDGKPVWPFALAVLDTWPMARKGQAVWDLNNVEGYWSLQIAVFYNEGEMRERKQAAEKYCRLLREEGVEAYYHHGTMNSSVCVGIFPKAALSEIQWEDPMTGIVQAKTKIVDSRMLDLQRKYPHNLHNGHRLYEITHNPRTGRREARAASFVSREAPAGRLDSRRSGRRVVTVPEILLATRNAGKIREIRQMTSDGDWVWHGLDDFPGVPDAVEDGATFAENARRKALHYAAATRLVTLADDSGLEVDCLGGAPGVHSARYAGTPHDDAANNRKLVAALAGVSLEQRTARFRCAMALARPGEVLLETEGLVAGLIIDEPRGSNGFGYDPHFLLPALGRTTAELPPDEKNALSHRGQALRAILPQIHALLRREW